MRVNKCWFVDIDRRVVLINNMYYLNKNTAHLNQNDEQIKSPLHVYLNTVQKNITLQYINYFIIVTTCVFILPRNKKRHLFKHKTHQVTNW